MLSDKWKFEEPPGTPALRSMLKERKSTDVSAVTTVVEAVRDGVDVQRAAQAAGITVGQARDIVAAVGATIGQALKRRSPRTSDIMEANRGLRAGLQPGTAYPTDDGYIVVAAHGWAGNGRDIRRSYAQVMLAGEADVRGAVERVEQAGKPEAPTREHYRDCWLAATTNWFTLADLATSEKPAQSYMQAVDDIQEVMQAAVEAVDRLVSQIQAREDLSQAVQESVDGWWLLPDFANAHRLAATSSNSPRLQRWADGVVRKYHEDESLRPQSLGQLSREQMDAVVASCELLGQGRV